MSIICVVVNNFKKLNHTLLFKSKIVLLSKFYSTSGHCLRLFSTVEKTMSVFKFNDYDCIGFDLDNTLLRYNITNMVLLEYDVLSKFLIEKKNYNPKYLAQPLGDQEFDFMQRGLILDVERGNMLRLAADGTIKKASHGTKKLSAKEICEIYPNQRWEISDIFIKDMLATWNGLLSEKIRALLDYFDMPTSLAFARIVDTLDEENEKPLNRYSIWPDLLEGLHYMFARENFHMKNNYFKSLRANPEKYFHICHPEVISWIKQLRKKSKLFLLTGSNADFVDFTASYSLGKNWKSLFDIIICFAKKPGFFSENRPFYELDGYEEVNIVKGEELKKGNVYSQGNWKELLGFISKESGVNNPRCLYIGDNIIQDIYVPKVHAKCDTIAVTDEQLSEKMFHCDLSHSDEKIINSIYWGSYFTLKDDESAVDSYWNHLVRSSTKLCVPQLDVFSKNPIDKSYECFDDNNKKSCGYYPARPSSAL